MSEIVTSSIIGLPRCLTMFRSALFPTRDISFNQSRKRIFEKNKQNSIIQAPVNI
jgi:hypothetical protein